MLTAFIIPFMESASQKSYHSLRFKSNVSQVVAERLLMFIIFAVMTGIIALRRLATFTRFKPTKQYHYKHKKYNPPTYSRLCSKWKPLRNVIIWLTIFCEPTLHWKTMVNGLPLVTETNEMMLPSTTSFGSSGIEEHQADDYYIQDDVNDATDSQGFEDSTDEPDEFPASFTNYDFLPSQKSHKFGVGNAESQEPETARYARDSNMMMIRPRRKKGLSYLSKYYSQAILNNTNSNNIFGINVGSSGEQRFPSVRRKLSFYPPLTLMNPWSRAGPGSRSANMRLRWGK